MINKNEIRANAFSVNFDINAIKDNVITMCELKHVKPLLGDALYLLVKTTPNDYCQLLELVKPYLSYMIKAEISVSNHVKTGNKGAQTATGTNEQVSDVEIAKREALAMAKNFEVLIKTWKTDYGFTSNETFNGYFAI